MKQEYCIWIAVFPGYVHSQCFYDQAIPLQAALAEMGYDAPIVREPMQGRCNILLGGHLLKGVPDADCIVWNLEQVAADVPWLNEEYLNLLKSKPVWDYSDGNQERLKGMGVEAGLMRVGYHACMRFAQDEEKTIDVLHYGSMNQRRAKVLQALQDRGVRVFHAFGAYGKERDALVAKARMVLNISYYESRIFNITRCALLFANGVPVVSETGPGSEAFHGTGGFAAYDDLATRCLDLLNGGERQTGQAGFEIFSAMKQRDYLEGVLC